MPINKWDLLKKNMKGTFFKPYEIVMSSELRTTRGAVIFMVLHSLLLPVTIPLFGIGKTIIDINTRHEIPGILINQLIDELNEKVNEEDFNLFLKEIYKYDPQSDSSSALLKQLKQLDANVENDVLQVQKSLKEKIIKDYSSQNTIKFNNKNQAIPYKITPEEAGLITKEAEEARIKFDMEKRKQQVAILKEYLLDQKNTGKKMQHVIKDAIGLKETECDCKTTKEL